MLKVLDFYKDDKIKLNKVANILMLPASIYVIVRQDKNIKEFLINIPKKFCYSVIKKDFIKRTKIDEYSILKDFLLFSKEMILKKFQISEEDYNDLILGIDLCVIDKYSNLSKFSKKLEILKNICIDGIRRIKDKWTLM